MKVFKILPLSILLCLSIQANASTNKDAQKNIQQVVEDFRVSLIEKDKEKFLSLFYGEHIPWLGVVSDKTMARHPERSKKRGKINSGNYESFIDWIVTDSKPKEEKFWDINIQSDGEIGTVHFKYSFHNGDYKTNWGDEAWHMVKTKGGWKINSVIYSITINPEPDPSAKPAKPSKQS
ncbi:MAG: nuclear transport factor 2 family protein [Algicola sp.]|nr:nuclear transport factor 2 family protein [Algicola sp.]